MLEANIGSYPTKEEAYQKTLEIRLLQANPHELVDHINLNKLDNRRCNLRIATHSQNSQNRDKLNKRCTSKYVGVRKTPQGNWSAQIKNKYLGRFDNEEDAARRYNEEALKLFGEHAYTNMII